MSTNERPKDFPKHLHWNTDEEEAAIQRGIAEDPDNPEWTDEDWAKARPAAEVCPELIGAKLRVRGSQKAPTKVMVSIRLDRDLVETLRASGSGWQARVNEMLRQALER